MFVLCQHRGCGSAVVHHGRVHSVIVCLSGWRIVVAMNLRLWTRANMMPLSLLHVGDAGICSTSVRACQQLWPA